MNTTKHAWYIITLLPILFEFLRLCKSLFDHKEASKHLTKRIEGVWYSAEFDLKQKESGDKGTNAILEIEIKRNFFGNRVTVVTGTQLNSNKKKTAWKAKGKIVTTDTLVLDWKGEIDDSTRYGNCFIQFIENGRGVGYWIGYASNTSGLPVYGYWIISRDRGDLEKLAALALEKFTFIDIKNEIESN